MSLNDFLYDDNYKKDRDFLYEQIKFTYYSNTGYFLRTYMELDEFVNEVYIFIIKYWNFDNFKASLRVYLRRVINNVLGKIYQMMDMDKRRVNHIQDNYRLDKEREEGEEEIQIGIEDNFFNEEKCINYIIEGIKDGIEKEIIKMYLYGVNEATIQKELNVNRRYVTWRKQKYRQLIQKRFIEYKNNTVN